MLQKAVKMGACYGLSCDISLFRKFSMLHKPFKQALLLSALLLGGNSVYAQKAGFPLSNLDKSADPCTNFYQYAAGGWMKNNPMPSTESRWGSFNILAKANDVKIKAILEASAKKPGKKGSPEQLVGDFYTAAMDSAAREKAGVKPLAPLFQRIQAVKSVDELAVLSGSLRPLGMGGLFGFYVSIDAKNSSENIVYISQGGLGLPDRDYYTKTDEASVEIRNAYQAHIDKQFALAGLKEKEAGKRILALETALAEVSMTRVERRDPEKTYNLFTKEAFEAHPQWSDFYWQGFFEATSAKNFEKLIVGQPAFLAGMVKALQSMPLEDWKSYFRWQVINASTGSLTFALEQESFNFYQKTLSGTPAMKPRWERAVSQVNGQLGETLGQLFVKAHFSPESKRKVSEMVENLRTAFGQRIEALEWMSDATKKEALHKLSTFTYKIGYPDKWKDYSQVDIQRGKHFQNVLNTRARAYAIMIEKIGQPVDKTEWGMTPQTVNAYYSATRNEIVFPAGILQAPFYDPQADDAVNYGGIGAVIGHEFSHGFDDKGSKFDAEGNLKNWWSAEDRAAFEERTNKIVDQYNRMEVLDGVFVNGSLTQGENIADLAGLTMAYYALKNAYKGNEPAPIDGYSWQQRFFLGWTHVWSQNISEKELRRRILTDSHAPGKERVLGPLANMPEFWEAFNCHPGNPMVAPDEQRVSIW